MRGGKVLRPIYDISGTRLTNTSSFSLDREQYLREGAWIIAFSEYCFSLPPGLKFKNSRILEYIDKYKNTWTKNKNT